MTTLRTYNGKPIDDPAATAGSPPATVQDPTVTAAADTHKDICGKVGLTGLHGKLGTNAK